MAHFTSPKITRNNLDERGGNQNLIGIHYNLRFGCNLHRLLFSGKPDSSYRAKP